METSGIDKHGEERVSGRELTMWVSKWTILRMVPGEQVSRFID
jgi:hypothetical protein